MPRSADPVEPDVLDTRQAGPKAIRGSALRSGAWVGGILVALLSAPLMVRHIGRDDFGSYTRVGATLAVFAGLVDAGLLIIAQREYVARQGADRDRVMANMLGLRIALTGGAIMAAIGFMVVAGYGWLVIGGGLLSIGLMLVSVQHMYGTPLVASLRNGVTSAIDFFGQAGQALVIVVLVLIGAGLLPFFAVGLIPALGAVLVTAWLVRGNIPLRPRFDRGVWWELMKDSLPYVAAAATTALYFRLAIVILGLVSNDYETGRYAVAFRLLEIMLGVPALLVTAAFPLLARAADTDPARFRYQIGRIFEVALILGLWFLLGIELVAPFALEFIAGAEGDASVSVFRLQGPAILFTFFAVASAFPLLALRRHREVLVANLVGLAVGVVLTLMLAPSYGASGTAIAIGAAELGLSLTMTVQLFRAVPEAGFPWRTLPYALGLFGLALLLLAAPLHPLIRTLLGTGIYLGGLWMLGRLPIEALEALRLKRPTVHG